MSAKSIRLISPNPWAQLSTRVKEAHQDHRLQKPHYYEANSVYNRAQAITDQSTFTVVAASSTGLRKEFTGYGN